MLRLTNWHAWHDLWSSVISWCPKQDWGMDLTSETQPPLLFSNEVPSLEQGEGGVPVSNTARLCPQCISDHGWRQTSEIIPSVSEACLHLAVKIAALCFVHALTCSRPCTWALSPALKWTLGGVPRAGLEAPEASPGCGIWSHHFEDSHCIYQLLLTAVEIPDTGQWGKEGFVCTHSLKTQYGDSMGAGAWGCWSHSFQGQEAGANSHWCWLVFFSFIQSGTPTSETMLSAFRVFSQLN